MKTSKGNIDEGLQGGILVVDDEPALRDILRTCLQNHDFRVWTAANGKEALELFSKHSDKIAVVLLDVQMPGLDGPQTLDGIRQLSPNVLVCFMTGDPGKHKPADLIGRGARYLFDKPFRLEEITRVIRNLANESMA